MMTKLISAIRNDMAYLGTTPKDIAINTGMILAMFMLLFTIAIDGLGRQQDRQDSHKVTVMAEADHG